MTRLALILSLMLAFTAPAAFAYDGLSIGVGIGVATDIGDFKNSDINNIRQMKDGRLDHDSVAVTPNISLHVRLDFLNLFFMRAGIEHYELAEGKDIEGHNQYGDINISYDYRCTAVPVIFGINIPVKRGRYNIYAGMGPSFVKINFEKEYELTFWNFDFGQVQYTRGRVEGDIDGPGTAFIAGLSINLTQNLHFSIEFQKLYLSRYTTLEGYQDVERPPGVTHPEEHVQEIINLSAPSDIIRFGLVYDI